MVAIPHNSTLLCVTDVSRSGQVTSGGITFIQDNIQEFEVISMSDDIKEQYRPGDKVITDVFPTEICYDGKTFYLVKAEHIVGKIVS